jgi:peptidyl-prolyl cis-trans isomerase SurA
MRARLLFAVLVWALSAPAGARVIDRVAAIVNNEIITLSEVDEAIKKRPDVMQELERAAPDQREIFLDKMRSQALDQLIAEKLLEAEMRKKDLRASELEIERAFEGMIQANKTTREKFVEELKRRGMTVAAYREELGKQLQRRLLLDMLFRQHIKVSDEDVKTFYAQNVNAVRADTTEYCVSIILRHTPSGMKEADVAEQKKVATQVRDRLRMGEDFAALAKQFSQDPKASEGGDIGCFGKGVMVAQFEKAVQALKKGETSDVIETPQGFYLVRVNDIKGSSVLPFDQVKENIRMKLTQDALERQVTRWVDEQKKKAFIDKKIQEKKEPE